MLSVKMDIGELRRKIYETKKQLLEGFEADAHDMMEDTLESVKRLTPVDTGKTQKNWILHKIGGGAKSRARVNPAFYVIYNKMTHTISGRVKDRAKLKNKNYTLVEVLEYGSRPHETKPGVMHPGTKPYAMIRLSSVYLQGRIKQFVQNWESKIVAIWKR